MNINDLKSQFPETPDNIRQMISNTVAAQTAEETTRRKAPIKLRRGLLIAAAVVLVLSVTAAAADIVHRFHSQPVGNYGLDIVSEPEDVTAETVEEEKAPVIVTKMSIDAGWLPEGVSASDEDDADNMRHYYNEDGELVFFAIQEFTSVYGRYQITEENVTLREDITVAGHDGVYMERLNPSTGETGRCVYIHFPEKYSVVCVRADYAEADRETLIKVAENLTLSPVPGTQFDLAGGGPVTQFEDDRRFTTVSDAEMSNTHSVGDTFEAEFHTGENLIQKLDVRVSDVEVSGSSSILDPEFISDTNQALFNGDGSLKPAEVKYISSGDGINSLSQVVYTEEAQRKLVLVTMEITNTTDSPVENLSYFPGIVYLEKTDSGYSIHEKSLPGTRTAPNGKAYDRISETGRLTLDSNEMIYCKSDGEGNYVSQIAPGETAVVQVGYIVNEDMLPYMYFYADGLNSTSMALNTRNLSEGYVDIRG